MFSLAPCIFYKYGFFQSIFLRAMAKLFLPKIEIIWSNKIIQKAALSYTPYPLFQWYPQKQGNFIKSQNVTQHLSGRKN
jgi:hypothetical protein